MKYMELFIFFFLYFFHSAAAFHKGGENRICCGIFEKSFQKGHPAASFRKFGPVFQKSGFCLQPADVFFLFPHGSKKIPVEEKETQRQQKEGGSVFLSFRNSLRLMADRLSTKE